MILNDNVPVRKDTGDNPLILVNYSLVIEYTASIPQVRDKSNFSC